MKTTRDKLYRRRFSIRISDLARAFYWVRLEEGILRLEAKSIMSDLGVKR